MSPVFLLKGAHGVTALSSTYFEDCINSMRRATICITRIRGTREVPADRNDVFRTRQSSLDLHLPWLDDQCASGCRNGAELWRRLKTRGFRGSLRVISDWATRRRRAKKATRETFREFRRPEQSRAS